VATIDIIREREEDKEDEKIRRGEKIGKEE